MPQNAAFFLTNNLCVSGVTLFTSQNTLTEIVIFPHISLIIEM